jgi:hypothetical protein
LNFLGNAGNIGGREDAVSFRGMISNWMSVFWRYVCCGSEICTPDIEFGRFREDADMKGAF